MKDGYMMDGYMIELEGVSFSYPDGTRVFDDFSFTLSQGKRKALTGRMGSGKSTLLRLIMGLITPSEGSVRLFGSACRSEEDFSLARRRIGFVFQDSEDQLFCPTVEEDIAFGPLNLGRTHAETGDDVREALGLLGITELRHKVTHRLSGGQKRLAAIATAIAMRPEVMILDEPTAGLDERGRQRLLEYIRDHCQTCLIASHDIEFLDAAGAERIQL